MEGAYSGPSQCLAAILKLHIAQAPSWDDTTLVQPPSSTSISPRVPRATSKELGFGSPITSWMAVGLHRFPCTLGEVSFQSPKDLSGSLVRAQSITQFTSTASWVRRITSWASSKRKVHTISQHQQLLYPSHSTLNTTHSPIKMQHRPLGGCISKGPTTC